MDCRSAARATALLLLLAGCTSSPSRRALAPYRTSVDQNPDQFLSHYEYGSAAFALEEYEIARDAFLKTLEMEPGHTTARMKLAQCYWSLGDMFLARDVYKEILDGEATHRDAKVGLGNLDMTLIMAFEQAGNIWIYGGSATISHLQALMLAGWGLDFQGMMAIYQEALDVWRDLTKVEQANAEIWANLGVIANLTNNIDGSKISFERAMAFKKDVLENRPLHKEIYDATLAGHKWTPVIRPTTLPLPQVS